MKKLTENKYWLITKKLTAYLSGNLLFLVKNVIKEKTMWILNFPIKTENKNSIFTHAINKVNPSVVLVII